MPRPTDRLSFCGPGPHSYNNNDEVTCNHINLDLAVSFAETIFSGTVELQTENVTDATEYKVDVRVLDIKAIVDKETGEALEFEILQFHDRIGDMLKIKIPQAKQSKGCKVNYLITYSTTKEAPACQWMEPSQTAGGKYPQVFTQSEAIVGR